jgi:hypothetical protein
VTGVQTCALPISLGSDRTAPELFQTALADTLPVTPAGDGALSGAFSPALTDVGMRLPVTADLVRRAKWGEWLTQADIRADRGQTLMQGRDGKPLLVVDQVGEGRVAVVASDNLWLWAKGGRTAGPYNELLRNLSHWLMKEPELEQDYLKAEARGRVITVSQRDDGTGPRAVAMTAPDGAEESLTLSTPQDGWLVAEVTADQNGIYVFQSGERKAFVVVGTARSEEYNDVLTTPARLTPAVTATGGATVWHEDMGALRLRAVDAGARRLHGDNWIGLRRNEAYDVIAVKARTLVTNPLFLLLAMGGLLLAWLAESGRRWRR